MKTLITFLSLAVVLSGCAELFSPPSHPTPISSGPAELSIFNGSAARSSTESTRREPRTGWVWDQSPTETKQLTSKARRSIKFDPNRISELLNAENAPNDQKGTPPTSTPGWSR